MCWTRGYGVGNFNAGHDEALSRFLWGVVEEMT